MGVYWLSPTILGMMWHVQARPYGSSRQQDVDIRDERARLSSWMRKRLGEAVVYDRHLCTVYGRPNAAAVSRLSPGLVSSN
jgi:hypothetical protein